jgi:hypothetical protein
MQGHEFNPQNNNKNKQKQRAKTPQYIYSEREREREQIALQPGKVVRDREKYFCN